jgi:hypothetical protein
MVYKTVTMFRLREAKRPRETARSERVSKEALAERKEREEGEEGYGGTPVPAPAPPAPGITGVPPSPRRRTALAPAFLASAALRAFQKQEALFPGCIEVLQ